MPAGRSEFTKRQKDLIIKALTDVNFRNQLQKDPQKALGTKTFDAAKKTGVAKILKIVQEIESKISQLADELLCANGGPCGIAKGGLGGITKR